MSRLALVVVGCSLLVFCLTGMTVAATVDTQDIEGVSYITSISNLTVTERISASEWATETYNVDFVFDTIDHAFAGGFDFSPVSLPSVTSAAAALGEELDGYDHHFIYKYTGSGVDSEDADDNGYKDVSIPYFSDSDHTANAVVLNCGGPANYFWEWSTNDLESAYYNNPLARFTPVSEVPIPGAVWLLGSGLIGLVGIRRKINI